MSETENVNESIADHKVASAGLRREGGKDGVADHRVVKEAEVKLKEMSRKAKERKTVASAPRKPPQKQGTPNLRLVFIGGLGIGVLGILYLMLRGGQKEQLVFTPKESEATRASADAPQKPVQASPKKKTQPQSSETRFEMNSF